MALGALAFSWTFLMRSYVHDPSLTTGGKLVILAYPILDIALVFIVFRSLLFGRVKQTYCRVLAAALIITFLADFVYDLLVLHSSYSTGNPVDATLPDQLPPLGRRRPPSLDRPAPSCSATGGAEYLST